MTSASTTSSRPRTDEHGGDPIYSGHTFARRLRPCVHEGRISEEQMNNFRQEVRHFIVLPAPWLMPLISQFRPFPWVWVRIQAIYQGTLHEVPGNSWLHPEGKQKVRCFLAMASATSRILVIAGRRSFDNLIFVINCNCCSASIGSQWQDHPGTEGVSAVLSGTTKVIWGRFWGPTAGQGRRGILACRAWTKSSDGEYQNYKAKDGAFVFFNTPELGRCGCRPSDDDLAQPWRATTRTRSTRRTTRSTTKNNLRAKTIKGYGTGAGEGSTPRTPRKSMSTAWKLIPRPLRHPGQGTQLENLPSSSQSQTAPVRYLLSAALHWAACATAPRQQLQRTIARPEHLKAILTARVTVKLHHHGLRAYSGAVGQGRDIGPHRPDHPDEARTFGMEGMFRQLGILLSAALRASR